VRASPEKGAGYRKGSVPVREPTRFGGVRRSRALRVVRPWGGALVSHDADREARSLGCETTRATTPVHTGFRGVV